MKIDSTIPTTLETDARQEPVLSGVIDHYLDRDGQNYFARQNRGAQFVSQVNRAFFQPHINTDDDVLDFGCGGGNLLHVLNCRTKCGIDINPMARAFAASQGITAYAKVEELAGESFSRIITCHALEHVPSPYRTLTQLRELVRLDGLLIWLSPLDDWRARHQRKWIPKDHDMHIYTWTPLLMGNLLSATGFQPQSISIVTHAVPPLQLATWLWKINHRLLHRAAYLNAALLNRRQLLAIASPIKL